VKHAGELEPRNRPRIGRLCQKDGQVPDIIQERKAEHLHLTATADVESHRGAGWSDVHLLHTALPELDLDDIDCSQVFLGRRLSFPLVIASMTGGFEAAEVVNAILGQAAELHGLALGVGSQRAALARPDLAMTYARARHEAPSAFVIANIGAPQLIAQNGQPALSARQVQSAVEMIRADALAVHLNYLQELVQPEGDRQARGCCAAIGELSRSLSIPLIGKETGAGMTRRTAAALAECGVAALDVGGAGGTSFAAVEGLRATSQGNRLQANLGEVFRDWGVPTPVSVREAATTGLPVIATGGVRTGLDAARAIALGASLVGVARPLVQSALEGPEAVDAWLQRFMAEFRAAMFLTGSRTLEELRGQPTVLLGDTREWLLQLGHTEQRAATE
jgi:isopentenyl-diphosphate delta-isomerase